MDSRIEAGIENARAYGHDKVKIRLYDEFGNYFDYCIIHRDLLKSQLNLENKKSLIYKILLDGKINKTGFKLKAEEKKFIDDMLRLIAFRNYNEYVVILYSIKIKSYKHSSVINIPKSDIIACSYKTDIKLAKVSTETGIVVALSEKMNMDAKLWNTLNFSIEIDKATIMKDINGKYSMINSNAKLVSLLMESDMCSVVNVHINNIELVDADDTNEIVYYKCADISNASIKSNNNKYEIVETNIDGNDITIKVEKAGY